MTIKHISMFVAALSVAGCSPEAPPPVPAHMLPTPVICPACQCPEPAPAPVCQPGIPPSLVLDLVKQCRAGTLDLSEADIAVMKERR